MENPSSPPNRNRAAEFKQPRNKNLKRVSFSKRYFLFFVLIFAVVGGSFLLKSFAATTAVKIWDTQADFNTGVKNQVEVTPAGTITLAKYQWGSGSNAFYYYQRSGSITLSFDSGQADTTWTALNAVKQLPAGTGMYLEGRSSRDNATWSAYYQYLQYVPKGRYFQVKATLRTSNLSLSPIIDSIALTFSTGGAPIPVSLNLSAQPTSVAAGSKSALSWTSSGTSSCSASGAWSGTKPTSGNEITAALTATSTFSLTCTGAGGTATKSATVTVTTAPPPPPPAPPPPPPTGSNCTADPTWGTNRTDFAAQVLTLVNQHRASLGLSQLSVSSSLKASAEWKSLHMAKYNYFAHDDPSPPIARSVFTRLTDCGYKGSGAGENIAYGYSTPQSVMTAWLNSAGHKANLENSSWLAIGIGVASNSSGTLYWTQDFGNYAGNSPSLSTSTLSATSGIR